MTVAPMKYSQFVAVNLLKIKLCGNEHPVWRILDKEQMAIKMVLE